MTTPLLNPAQQVAPSPAPLPPSSAASRGVGILAQLVGLLVFFAGLAALWYVFQTANALLTEPTPILAQPVAAAPVVGASAANTAPSAQQPNAALQIGQDFAGFLRRLLVLLLLCVVGGVVSSVGANLFFKARRGTA